MLKYRIGNIVETKEGIGQIVDVFKINDMITMYKIFLINDTKEKNMYFGELGKVVATSFEEFEKDFDLLYKYINDIHWFLEEV